jgi:hypothetical protein
MAFLIFPSFNPPQWDITWPIKQTPFYNTIKKTPASGRGENRISTTNFPRWKFALDVSYLRGDNQGVNTAWQTLLNFFMAVQGSFANWLFLHPFDHSVSLMPIATGNGSTLAFSMIRTLVSAGAQELIQNFVSPPSIYLNGVLQGSGYSIDQYGTITFTVAPGAGVVIVWTGQFYYLCHFSDDAWEELQEDYYQLWSIHELKFESVLL